MNKKTPIALLFLSLMTLSASASSGELHLRLNETQSQLPFQDYAGSINDNAEVLNETGADFAVNGVDSSINGVKTGLWGDGKAVNLTGNSVLNVSQSPDTNITDDTITLSSWVRPFSLGSNQYFIRKKGAYSLGIFSGDTNIELFGFDTTPGTIVEADQSNLDTGSWNHVVAVYNGTAGKLYIDGTLVKTNKGVSGSIPSSNKDVGVGGNLGTFLNSDDAESVPGAIDEPRIFDQALDNTQVNNLYQTNSIQADVNTPPDLTNPSPQDGSEAVNTSTTLSIDYTDPESDTGNVYLKLNGTVKRHSPATSSGSTVSSSVSLQSGTFYEYEVNASDGNGNTVQKTFSFTTEKSSASSSRVVHTKDGGQEQQGSILSDSSGGLLISVSEDRVLESLNLFNGEEGVSETVRVIDDGNGTEIFSETTTFGQDNYTFPRDVLLQSGRTYKIVNTGGDRAFIDTGQSMPETDGAVTFDGEVFSCNPDGTGCSRGATSSFVGFFYELTTSSADPSNSVSISSPSGEVAGSGFELAGSVNENSNLTYEVDGNGTQIELGNEITEFSEPLELPAGVHTIQVTSVDSGEASDTSTASTTFTIVSAPRVKSISETQNDNEVTFKFNLTDDAGISNATLKTNLSTFDDLTDSDLADIQKSPENPVLSSGSNWVTTPEFIVVNGTVNLFWNRNQQDWKIMRATAPVSDPDSISRANNDQPVFSGSSGAAEWFAPINNCDRTGNLPCYAYFTDNNNKDIGLAKTNGNLNDWVEVKDTVVPSPSYYSAAAINQSSNTIHILYNSGTAGGDMYHATAPLSNPGDVALDPDNPVATSEDFRELDLIRSGDEWRVLWHEGEDESCTSGCNPYDAMTLTTKNFDSFDINQSEILSESASGWDSREILGLKFVPEVINNKFFFGYTGRESSNGIDWDIGMASTSGSTTKTVQASNGTNTLTFNFSGLDKPVNLEYTITGEDVDGVSSTTQTQKFRLDRANIPPSASVSANSTSIETGNTVFFDASGSTDSDGSITQYDYDFDGDGTFEAIGSGPTFENKYSSVGSFDATVRVTDDQGATSTAVTTITVGSPPTADITANTTSIKTGETVQFDASGSNDPGGSIISTEFDLNNDGTFETSGTTAQKKFESSGSFTVDVRVTDTDSNTDTASVSVTVNKRDFFVENLPPGLEAGFPGNLGADPTSTNPVTEGNTKNVVFGPDKNNGRVAAGLEIAFDSNVSASAVDSNADRSQGKSYVHLTSSISEVQQKNLYIPRENNTGQTHICPGATSLSETFLGCSNGFNISTGETVNGVTLSEVTLGGGLYSSGDKYYKAAGVTGTGGVEVSSSSSNTGGGGSGGGGGGGSGGGGGDGGFGADGNISWDEFSATAPVNSSKTFTFEAVNNVEEEVTVSLSVPDTRECSFFELRNPGSGNGFGDSVDVDVSAKSNGVPGAASVEARVDMPGRGSLGSDDVLSCDLTESASSGEAVDLELRVEPGSSVLGSLGATIQNTIGLDTGGLGSGPTIEFLSITGGEQEESGFTVPWIVIIGVLAGAAWFVRP